MIWKTLLPVLLLCTTLSARAQSLSGLWQGVELDPEDKAGYWPAELRLQQGKSGSLFGVLYHEVGDDPAVTVTFQVRGTRTADGLRLEHGRKLNETGQSPFSYWCAGAIRFTYDAAQEKLTGRAAYQPIGNCSTGDFTLYRVVLKSAATVPAGAETTIRVSGRNVLWYADAQRQRPLATGNAYRTRLTQTTTFYLAQGYYPTSQSALVPITVRVGGPALVVPPPAVEPLAPAAAQIGRAAAVPLPATVAAVSAPQPALLSTTPVVLPTVLFKLGTAQLLAEARPALARLAAELQARPELHIEVAGHTDRIGEPQKNLVLSEQRAEAVKKRLIAAGVAAGRISTVGYGDARPLHPSPDARNRRVEVRVIE
ncbi:OmpA family protein [Hymenobacter sp. NST-14]|uniref:OmpA family protein n=1 Tax=Hymenobacter piscis TaxID=2839984 RepID=UPI001C02E20F|nr:OmpA family protein [Hymenobacter piscis]MBT9392430.1 OmpA family protein [Hymenobacter piscis]